MESVTFYFTQPGNAEQVKTLLTELDAKGLISIHKERLSFKPYSERDMEAVKPLMAALARSLAGKVIIETKY